MIATPDSPDATQSLIDWSKGNEQAANGLMALLYDELRRLARGHLQRERSDHTLQATGLAHEAYMRLVDQRRTTWRDRTHFFGAASKVMRRVLVDHARRHRAEKRGGEWDKVEFDEAWIGISARGAEALDKIDVSSNIKVAATRVQLRERLNQEAPKS